MITVRQVNNDKSGMKDFVNFQYTLYQDDANWCPPLRFERKKFFSAANPFLLHGRVAYFVAYEGDRPVGRVTAHTDSIYDEHYNTRQGFFGFFEAENNPEIAEKLMAAVEDWLAGYNVESILGPFNFSINHEIGFLYEGFDRPPVIMMPYTKSYYLDLLYHLGYQKEKILIAYWADTGKEIPPIISKAAARVEREFASDITIRNIDKKNIHEDLRTIMEVYNEAWRDNWGFIPMTPEEIEELGNDLKFITNPVVTYILSFRGESAAILVAVPDLNEILITIRNGRLLPTGIFKILLRLNKIKTARIILMGVKSKYQKMGLDILLYHRMIQDGLAKTPYRNIEMSWILEDNVMMNGILVRSGADPYKKYLVMKKNIHPSSAS